MKQPTIRRTPIPQLVVGTVRLLTRRAMLGWLLKAFAFTVLALVPLAAISTYRSVESEHRWPMVVGAAIVVCAALLLHRVGRWLRREGS